MVEFFDRLLQDSPSFNPNTEFTFEIRKIEYQKNSFLSKPAYVIYFKPRLLLYRYSPSFQAERTFIERNLKLLINEKAEIDFYQSPDYDKMISWLRETVLDLKGGVYQDSQNWIQQTSPPVYSPQFFQAPSAPIGFN